MRLLLASALLASLPAPSLVAAATSEQPAQIQQTSARVAAERFLAELNGPGSTEQFVASTFSQVSLSREPAIERARQFDRLKALAGGFEVLDWRPQGERMIEVVALSKSGNRHAKFVLFTSGKEPGKIADVFVLPEREPARAAPQAVHRAACPWFQSSRAGR